MEIDKKQNILALLKNCSKDDLEKLMDPSKRTMLNNLVEKYDFSKPEMYHSFWKIMQYNFTEQQICWLLDMSLNDECTGELAFGLEQGISQEKLEICKGLSDIQICEVVVAIRDGVDYETVKKWAKPEIDTVLMGQIFDGYVCKLPEEYILLYEKYYNALSAKNPDTTAISTKKIKIWLDRGLSFKQIKMPLTGDFCENQIMAIYKGFWCLKPAQVKFYAKPEIPEKIMNLYLNYFNDGGKLSKAKAIKNPEKYGFDSLELIFKALTDKVRYSEYWISDKLTEEQIERIIVAVKEGLSLELLKFILEKNVESDTMKEIIPYLVQGKYIEEIIYLVDNGFDYYPIRQILLSLEDGADFDMMKQYIKPNQGWNESEQIAAAFETNKTPKDALTEAAEQQEADETDNGVIYQLFKYLIETDDIPDKATPALRLLYKAYNFLNG